MMGHCMNRLDVSQNTDMELRRMAGNSMHMRCCMVATLVLLSAISPMALQRYLK